MALSQAIIISIVEGVTEFLPVSPTGHMIITQNLLGVPSGDEFAHAFTFIIQSGVILSVIYLYWKHFFQIDHTSVPVDGTCTFKKIIHPVRLYWLLFIGVLPAVIIGLAAKKNGLLDWLFGPAWVVAIVLVVGGIFILYCDRLSNKGKEESQVTEKRTFSIGLFQCLSVIPGTSRSMATIISGMANGLAHRRAAEFSFFLAVPTMAGAALLDLFDLLKGDSTWASTHGLIMLAVSCVASFIVVLLTMEWFVDFLAEYGFKWFDWYRIIASVIIIIILLCDIPLNMIDWSYILIALMSFKEGVIIPIDKPYRITSFKALTHIHYLCIQTNGGKVRIGHASTLDPLATGVLILTTGKVTKQVGTLQMHAKEYIVTLQLGATTPDYDMEHEVNEAFPTEHITKELVNTALPQFVGDIKQIPPTYSAVKMDGKRAFDYRRKGGSVTLKPKNIRIDGVEVLDFDTERMWLSIRVVYGKGTYIRTLTRDLGRAVNNEAYLTTLHRTRIRDVRVEDYVNYDQFEAWLQRQTIER